MASFFTAHRSIALVVFVVAAAWVATGEFAAVGSEEAHATEGAPKMPVDAADTRRTVAAVRPVFSDFAREIRISGATEADKLAVLAARSNGIVQELGVTQGQTIAADVLVVRLEGADVDATVETAMASLAQAEERLRVGEALSARGSLPELELTSRRAEKAAAVSALSQAKAAQDRLLLKAPFAGSVDSVAVELGEWVQAGTPIATLLSLDPIVIKAEVSERDVAHVANGAVAHVRLVNGMELQGTIRHVAMQASATTRTFAVEVALPNPDRAIPSGMTAELSLFAAPQPAVIVPRSVITISAEGVIGLRVVGSDSRAAFAPVTVIEDTDKGLVLSGVPEDARIIVAGQDLVSDGDEVVVVEMTAEEAAARAASLSDAPVSAQAATE